jgi:hypothetical protein
MSAHFEWEHVAQNTHDVVRAACLALLLDVDLPSAIRIDYSWSTRSTTELSTSTASALQLLYTM